MEEQNFASDYCTEYALALESYLGSIESFIL